MPIYVDIHEHEVDRLFAPGGPVFSEVEATVNRGLNISRSICPVDEGRLRQSLHGGTDVEVNRIVGWWGSDLDYAIPRHDGWGIYGPHHRRVYPKKPGGVLVFKEFGAPFGPLPKGRRRRSVDRRGLVFAKSVRGAPGSPFLTAALELVMPGVPINRRHVRTDFN